MQDQKQSINITLEGLKDTFLENYALVEPSIGNKASSALYAYVLVELNNDGLRLITRTDNTFIVKYVPCIVKDFKPEEKQLFLVDMFLFKGFIKSLEAYNIKVNYDGTYLWVTADKKESKFLVKNADFFFNRNLDWQDIILSKTYEKVSIETLKEFYKAVQSVAYTTIKNDNKPQNNCIELTKNTIATTDERACSMVRLKNYLPLDSAYKVLFSLDDYKAIEKSLAYIINTDLTSFEMCFEEMKDKQGKKYITGLVIKSKTDDIVIYIKSLNLDLVHIDKRIAKVNKGDDFFSFDIDFSDYVELIKTFNVYEIRALTSNSDDTHTKISINDNKLTASINIEDLTSFESRDIPVTTLLGESLDFNIKATQLIKILPTLKDTEKLTCVFKNPNMRLVLYSEKVDNFEYFITS